MIIVLSPDPASKSGSGTFEQFVVFLKSRDHKIVMETSLKRIDCREAVQS